MIQNRQSLLTQVPCTCGELFQGTLDGQPCLVSCPIDVYSTARIGTVADGDPTDGRRKVVRALGWVARHTGREIGVAIDNPLPVGRGYGTSTADIGAALFAASEELDFALTAWQASQIAAQIEPTDSTLFPGLALFDHRGARFQVPLGSTPPARVIILDPGGVVDSEGFNAQDWHNALARLAPQHRSAFQLLQQGVAEGDLLAIGEAATLSAVCHQAILDNPLVARVAALAKQLGAAGICRAHSGTLVGLIFPIDYDCASAAHFLSQNLPVVVRISHALLTGGGAMHDVVPEN